MIDNEIVIQKAVVSVLGLDRKGIIARVSNALYLNDANILDISQTVVSGYFSMIMVADISSEKCDFEKLSNELNALGISMGLQIRLQHSEIFEAMHKI